MRPYRWLLLEIVPLTLMKTFQVPIIYRSPLIAAIKENRRKADKLKKDFTPSLLDFGRLQVYLARHFGFCYGVENAIEISFRILEENPGKNVFLLSEMIHNPQVNEDLAEKGIRFLQDTAGNQLIPFESLTKEDIVITPAFGTTVEIEKKLQQIGIQTKKYNTTCPFVEKVWNRSGQLASNQYTVVIHGKPSHEETRATFSHAAIAAPTVIVKDMAQAAELAAFIRGERAKEEFFDSFRGQHSDNFDPIKDLRCIGVVNQTTMLASDTQAIADYLKETMIQKYGLNEKSISPQFADTRDTLCYATNDNQTAVTYMLETAAELAIVVGGFNSSNTSHLVELCENKLTTYFVGSAEDLLSPSQIHHFDFHSKAMLTTSGYLSKREVPARVLITSGASCPDALVEGIIRKLALWFAPEITMEEMRSRW